MAEGRNNVNYCRFQRLHRRRSQGHRPGAVLDGGGIKILADNVGFIMDKMMPEDEEKRAALMSVFDELVYDFADATTAAGGEITNRIGNEIMINAKDLT